jgi:hypothetical protein
MTLPYLLQKQLLPNWCWSAVASSISFYYNRNQFGYRQGDIAGMLLGNSCNIGAQNSGSASTFCDQPADIALALFKTGNYAGNLNLPLSYPQVVAQINGHFPVCCEIQWPSAAGNHFVAIVGYSGNDLIIGDPDPDATSLFSISYNDFLNDYRGGGRWLRSIATHAPAAQ